MLALFASISILSYGILPKTEIAALPQPSVGGLLEAAVGAWGGTFIRLGLIVSVLGAYLHHNGTMSLPHGAIYLPKKRCADNGLPRRGSHSFYLAFKKSARKPSNRSANRSTPSRSPGMPICSVSSQQR